MIIKVIEKDLPLAVRSCATYPECVITVSIVVCVCVEVSVLMFGYWWWPGGITCDQLECLDSSELQRALHSVL